MRMDLPRESILKPDAETHSAVLTSDILCVLLNYELGVL